MSVKYLVTVMRTVTPPGLVSSSVWGLSIPVASGISAVGFSSGLSQLMLRPWEQPGYDVVHSLLEWGRKLQGQGEPSL